MGSGFLFCKSERNPAHPCNNVTFNQFFSNMSFRRGKKRWDYSQHNSLQGTSLVPGPGLGPGHKMANSLDNVPAVLEFI